MNVTDSFIFHRKRIQIRCEQESGKIRNDDYSVEKRKKIGIADLKKKKN